MSYELDLILLAVALYLVDSSPLLYSNEMVFQCNRRGVWSVVQGRIVLARRLLCVLNPLTPHQPAFRLHWDLTTLPGERDNTTWSSAARELAALGPAVSAVGVGLFLVLPLAIFSSLGIYGLIPALLLIYGGTAVALYQLYRSCGRIALPRRRFIALAFECMACPPFAVNMVRKVTLAAVVNEPAPWAAKRLLTDTTWSPLRAHWTSVLDEAIEMASDPSERELLEAQRTRFMALGEGT